MVFYNKKAKFDYELIETFTAGIVLKGCEVKALDVGKSSIKDTFCYFKNGELFLRNCEMTIDDKFNFDKISGKRDRKLLLNKKELKKLISKLETKGLTIIPLKLYRNEKGLYKLDVSLAKGKQNYSKRNSIKENDINRETDRRLKFST